MKSDGKALCHTAMSLCSELSFSRQQSYTRQNQHSRIQPCFHVAVRKVWWLSSAKEDVMWNGSCSNSKLTTMDLGVKVVR